MNIEEIIRKAFKAKQLSEKFDDELQVCKQLIQQHFDKLAANNATIVKVDDIVASKRERVDIQYFPDKLRESLTKKAFNKVTNRTYIIKDIDGLIEILKEAEISPRDFKKYIEPQITVNKEAIKQLFETGDITKEDLDGCYSAKIVKYIDLRVGKGVED